MTGPRSPYRLAAPIHGRAIVASRARLARRARYKHRSRAQTPPQRKAILPAAEGRGTGLGGGAVHLPKTA
jgi:hypothetical protein